MQSRTRRVAPSRRVLEREFENLKRASAYVARKNMLPRMGLRLVHELPRNGVPRAVECRKLKVSCAGYCEGRERRPSPDASGQA